MRNAWPYYPPLELQNVSFDIDVFHAWSGNEPPDKVLKQTVSFQTFHKVALNRFCIAKPLKEHLKCLIK